MASRSHIASAALPGEEINTIKLNTTYVTHPAIVIGTPLFLVWYYNLYHSQTNADPSRRALIRTQFSPYYSDDIWKTKRERESEFDELIAEIAAAEVYNKSV
jgi:hypothetical protein